jgi:VWFA-related protein
VKWRVLPFARPACAIGRYTSAFERTNMKRLCRIAVILCLAAGTAVTVSWPVSIQAQEPKPTFRASVSLVPITAAVRDSRNRIVRGLTRHDFDVLENNQRREIVDFVASNDAALSLAIVADTSGSMRGRNWERANDFVDQLVSGLTKPGDEIALFTFDKTLCQQTPFTSDRDTVLDALRSVEAWGQTSLYDAVAEAAKRVAGRSGQRRAVLVVTDGVDTSSAMTAAEVSAIAGSIDVPVYAVSVEPASMSAPAVKDGQAGLAQLVSWTGGDVSHLSESGGLDRTIGALMAELRQQYFLAIQSDSTSGWHRIDVKTRRRDLSVRARTGYFATGNGAAPGQDPAPRPVQ